MGSAEVPITVAVRLRPLVARETNDQKCIRVLPDKKQIVLGKDRSFTFDYIFPPDCTQLEIFEQMCVPLITQCFDGYNGTVFAYGQTGSGKTHTIEGEIDEDDQMGIVPRSIKHIFQYIDENKSLGEFIVRVSFIELYKEDLHDLLDSENYPYKSLHIREDERGNTSVINAKEIVCTNADEVLAYAELGAALRRTEATQMNERSSRSHSIFTIIVEQRLHANANNEEGQFVSSKLHFVDLAGSERASKTGNVGERFKESIHINTGLLALGNVISALGDNKRKSGHIPYRDSKITRLLKDSLGGNSNTVMITCVPPTFNNFDESLNSLKYANRAKNIRNKPIVNRDSQSMRFEALQSEIMILKEELEREKSSKSKSSDDGVQTPGLANNAVYALQEKVSELCNKEKRLQDLLTCAFGIFQLSKSNPTVSPEVATATDEWMESFTNANIPPPNFENNVKTTIEELQKKLKGYEADLVLDEQIFSQKAQEVGALNLKMSELRTREAEVIKENETLRDNLEKCHDQLKLQQLAINDLQELMKTARSTNTGMHDSARRASDEEQSDRNPAAVPRPAKSAPVRRVTGPAQDFGDGDARNFYTSPAVYTMDKIVQSFRAKSQMLATQWEETDDVLCEHFENEPRKPMKPLSRSNSAKNPTPTVDAPTDASSIQALLKLPEIKSLRASVQYTEDEIQSTNVQIREANKKMRELALNIRLKEELIREMLKTGREANNVNKTFTDKIKVLEKERDSAKKDLKQMKSGESDAKVSVDNKLHSSLKKKQKEGDFIAGIVNHSEKKVSELTVELQKMKSQYELNQKRLKEESERKNTLQRELLVNTQKVNDLEVRIDQQQKILKRKNEEVAAMKKSKRQNFSPSRKSSANDAENEIPEADNDLEKLIQKKQFLAKMEEDIKKREELVYQKEVALEEKQKMEVKKLRASQVLSHEALSLANNVNKIEKDLEVATARGAGQQTLAELTAQRDALLQKRDIVDEQLREGSILGEKDERKLIELEEAVEMLEAAIDYKSDLISDHQQQIQSLNQFSETHIMDQISKMDRENVVALLSSYFEKVISLKEAERNHSLHENELMVKADEQERMIQELQSAVHQSKIEFDRRTVDIIREYENKTQMLLKQLQSNEENEGGANTEVDVRVKDLERELYYYKKTSRDLKKKLREMAAGGLQISEDNENMSASNPNSAPPSSRVDPQKFSGNGLTPIGSSRENSVLSPRDSRVHRSDNPSESLQQSGTPRVMENGVGPRLSGVSSTTGSVTVSKRDLRELKPSELSKRRSDAVASTSIQQDSMDI